MIVKWFENKKSIIELLRFVRKNPCQIIYETFFTPMRCTAADTFYIASQVKRCYNNAGFDVRSKLYPLGVRDSALHLLEIHKKNKESVQDLFYRTVCITGNLEKPPPEYLTQIYGVQTARLNQQVRRNKGRFPEDFSFQLIPE